MVSISLVALAGSVLLVGVHATVQTTDESYRQAVAQGMAEQLLDEIVGCRYAESAAAADDHPFAADPGEAGNRAAFDDIDDFDGFRASPPVDAWGIPLGEDDGAGGRRHASFRIGGFGRWQQEVRVYYVSKDDLTQPLANPPANNRDHRAVDVRIHYIDPIRGAKELARVRRIVAYVPPLP